MLPAPLGSTTVKTIMWLLFAVSSAWNIHSNILSLESPQSEFRNATNSTRLYIYYDADVGRLGNKLFAFASAYGIAHHLKRRLICRSDLKKLNQLLPNLDIDSIISPPIWERFHEKGFSHFDKRFFALPNYNVTIAGYLQSFKYFEDVNERIFKIYSNINPLLLKRVKIFKGSVKREARKSLSYKKPTTICLHVRREDILQKKNVDIGFRVVSKQDILFAMNWMENKFEQVLFIVATNGKEWCQKHLKRENVFISNFTSAEDDFTLMQSCDHMVMTVGTFSWWAGWMTSQRGGDVMYYRDYFTI